ncbi:MAG: DNA-binding response regulator [Owenweeksia sp.]|nr:DNA-binding response regulator [Owenweeksia sp.]
MSRSIKVFIVDDEPRAVDTLKKDLQTFFDGIEVVGEANSLEEAYNGILASRPELVFLDIEMGTESGFQLLERFDRVDFHVVFVTAHEEFALKAIKFSALDYLIKPAGISELKSILQKVKEGQAAGQENMKVRHMFSNFLSRDKSEHKITLSVAEGYEFIKVDDILYLRADGSYTDFFLKDATQLTTSRNLKFFESILEGYGFYRIHNSTIINLKYIKRFNRSSGGYIVMEDDTEFSISKSRKDEFMELLALR